MKTTQFPDGFTLIEMVVVIGIIAVLSLIALPSFEPNVPRKQVLESMDLIEDLKNAITLAYRESRRFPKNNVEAGIPIAEKLLGNYVDRIDLEQGAFHIRFGMKSHPTIKNKVLTIRPIFVKDSPESPISWLCGYSTIPAGMVAEGNDRTTLDPKFLPFVCRG